MAAHSGLVRALAVAAVLIGGGGLGALRVTPPDDDGGEQASGIDVEVSTSTTTVPLLVTTVPPPDTTPTTAPPATATPTSRPPLSPLPPAPTTTRPVPPPTTAPPTTAGNQPPVARDDGTPSQRVQVPADAHQFPIQVTDNDFDPDGSIDRSRIGVHGGRQGTIFATDPRQGVVYYSPPAGFRGNDEFQYTIWDNRGAPATATVYVQVG